MKSRPFKQIDVFGKTPYAGNPLAVVLDGTDLSDAEMQGFAEWTQLSETTFVLPPDNASADYRVRIFTPGGELPFAGHPTLGTCHGWLQAGGAPKEHGRIVQECAAGLVTLRRDGERLAFAAPPLTRTAPSPSLLAKVAAALGLRAQQVLSAQMLDNGPVWLGLLLDAPSTVLALKPDHRALKEFGHKVGVAGIHAVDAELPLLIGRSNREARAFVRSDQTLFRLEARAFASPIGIDEDPVTGSLQASLAQWLIEEGQLPDRYLAAQGQCLGRAGRIHVAREADGQVWVGGDSVTCIDGSVTL